MFNRYTSNYLEDSNELLYPFGYGLSYTHFQYDDMVLSSNVLKKGENLIISVIVTNEGDYDGCEVVQLYLHDIYADVVRPVKELKNFKRIFLKKGESREVRFVITEEDLKFYNSNLQYVYELGDFEVMVRTNSRNVQSKTFLQNSFYPSFLHNIYVEYLLLKYLFNSSIVKYNRKMFIVFCT